MRNHDDNVAYKAVTIKIVDGDDEHMAGYKVVYPDGNEVFIPKFEYENVFNEIFKGL